MHEFSGHEPVPPADKYNDSTGSDGYRDDETDVPYAYSPDGLDAEADMLPDGSYFTNDVDDDGDFEEGAEYEDAPQERTNRYTTEPWPMPPLEGRAPDPIPVEQRHYTGFAVTPGEHPDPVIAEKVEALVTRMNERQQQLTETLTEGPNENAAYAQEREQLATIAHEAYGIDPPITFLSREQWSTLCEEYPEPPLDKNASGMMRSGHVILIPDRSNVQLFGNGFVTALGMHEFGHAEGPSTLVVATRKAEPGEAYDPDKLVDGLQGQKYLIGTDWPGGLTETHDIPGRSPEVSGVFWDEGRADSRRVHTQEQLGIAIPSTGIGRFEGIAISEDTRITMTDTGIGTHRLSPDTGEIALPWKYALGLKLENGSPQGMYLPKPGLAAYGIDLLEQHALPGLREQMDEAVRRDDPALKQAVRDRINSIDGYLYNVLAPYPQRVEDYSNGVRRIILTLGIAGETV